MNRLRDFADVRRDIEDENPGVQLELRRTAQKRSIAQMLVRMRKQAGLTQTALAVETGWDKGFVSRLEGAYGGMPDTGTIARYATACGFTLRLVAGNTGDDSGAIEVTLQDDRQ
ncbi:helix-turn-helix transcriptional regulator [Fodinicurvata sp. EGI_FJ10296]|uniref:helix-turn-helix domain-containing protein n=1 Tax=Fodinicurvata sp. EGI_FJ10296 TaxID=3231908 RepID=UPI00345270DB